MEKDEDVKEGRTIKKQFETFQASKKAIEEQQRLQKVQLMQTYTKEIDLKHVSFLLQLDVYTTFISEF